MSKINLPVIEINANDDALVDSLLRMARMKIAKSKTWLELYALAKKDKSWWSEVVIELLNANKKLLQELLELQESRQLKLFSDSETTKRREQYAHKDGK